MSAQHQFDPALFTAETHAAGQVVRRAFFPMLWILIKTVTIWPIATLIFDTKNGVKPLPMPPPFDTGREPPLPPLTRLSIWVSYLGFLTLFVLSALMAPLFILPTFAVFAHVNARRIAADQAGEVPTMKELWGDLWRTAFTFDRLGFGIESTGRRFIPGGLFTVGAFMIVPALTGGIWPDIAWLTWALGALSLVLGLYLSFKAASGRASYLRQDREITIKHGHDLATWLGIPVQVFDKRTEIFYWGPQRDGIFIKRNTAVQAVEADFIEQKLAATWPELMVEFNDQRGLLLLPTTEEHEEERRYFKESGGLISGTTLASPQAPNFAPVAAHADPAFVPPVSDPWLDQEAPKGFLAKKRKTATPAPGRPSPNDDFWSKQTRQEAASTAPDVATSPDAPAPLPAHMDFS